MKLTLRSNQTQLKYETEKLTKPYSFCPLCNLPVIREIGNFLIVHNEYPYDRFFKVDDILITKEHKENLNFKDLEELEKIKKQLSDENIYDYVFENLPNQASIKTHWHVHFLKRYDDMENTR